MEKEINCRKFLLLVPIIVSFINVTKLKNMVLNVIKYTSNEYNHLMYFFNIFNIRDVSSYIIFALITTMSLSAFSQTLPTFQEILNIYASRAKEIESIRMTYDRRQTIFPESSLSGDSDEPIILPGKGEIIKLGESIRNNTIMDRWHSDFLIIRKDTRKESVYHKKTMKSFTEFNGRGRISLDDEIRRELLIQMACATFEEQPIFLTIEGMEVLRWDEVEGKNMLVIGLDPIKVKRSGLVFLGGISEYYLDPDIGYLPAKQRNFADDGSIVLEVDLIYGEQKAGGPVLEKIQYFTMASGEAGFGTSEELVITSFDVNVPVELYEFELEFPDGTVVFDKIRGVEYTVGKSLPDISEVEKWMTEALSTTNSISSINTNEMEKVSDNIDVDVSTTLGYKKNHKKYFLFFVLAIVIISVIFSFAIIGKSNRTS